MWSYGKVFFEAFMVMIFQVNVFCVVRSCSIMIGYQRFRGHTASIFRVK